MLDAETSGTAGTIMPLDAVFRHLVKHGGPKIVGLNVLPDMDDEDRTIPSMSSTSWVAAGRFEIQSELE